VVRRELVSLLIEKGIESPEAEAREILRFTEDEEEIFKIVEKRVSGYPLQYIIGEWDFYDVTLKVGEGVLIPRQDTETLVDEALRILKGTESPRVLDLCSGSGAIIISIKNNKNGVYFALEKEEKALKFLRENVSRYGGIEVIPYDLFEERSVERFKELDMITANPPYLTGEDMKSLQKEVEFEPKEALFGGEDGLIFYRFISENYIGALKEGGHLLFEVGASQAEDVLKIMEKSGFKNCKKIKDLCGNDRVCIGEK
jgi:release factor glutamine methyltransferase